MTTHGQEKYERDGGQMITGRDQELRRARAAVRRGAGVVLVGPAGVGKTALATTLVRVLDEDGCSTIRLCGTEAGRPVPFGALAELINGADPVEPALVLGRVVREIARRAGRRTPLVFVDDAHLLDGPSAGALLALAAGRHARVLVTIRADEPVPDAVVSLYKDHGLERLELAPFDREGTAAVVTSMLGGEVAAPTVDLLQQWTGGNPLFLCELVRAGRARRDLVVDAGLWWWRAPLSVPPVLAELLDRRVDSLGSQERDAIAAVALGEPLSIDVLEAVSSPAVVASLEDAGLVRAEEVAGRLVVRLDHPLLSAATNRRLSPARRRRVAGSLLAAARAVPTSRVDPVSLAIWQLEAHGEVEIDLLLRAAETILHTDPELAARLARRALDRGGGVQAATALAGALVESGDRSGARVVLESARARAAGAHDTLTAAVALAAHRAWAEREPAEAHDDLLRLRADLPPGPGRDELDSVDALVLLFAARTAEALEIADRLTTLPPSPAAVRAQLVRTVGRTLVGRTADGLAIAQAVVDAPAASLVGIPYARGMGLAALALAQLWRTPLAQAPPTDPARGRWPTSLDPATLGMEPTAWPLFDGYVRRVMGDREAAISRLREALVQQSGGEGLFRSEAAAWLALSLAESGRVDEAEVVLATQPPDAVAIVPGLLPWARAGVAFAQGRRAHARAHLDDAIAAARRSGCSLVELGYLTYSPDLQRAGHPSSLDRVREVITVVDAPRLVASAEAFLALFRGDGGQLLDHAGRLQSYGLRLAALEVADAARDALAAQPRLRAEATMLVGSLRQSLGSEAPPVRKDCDLTPREIEVTNLAAAGMSDREIAALLVVSVRTVETHLARAYRKLGVASRQELYGDSASTVGAALARSA